MDITVKVCKECDSELFDWLNQGLSQEAMRAKKMPSVKVVSIRMTHDVLIGGLVAFVFYGCVFIDTLYIDSAYREQGFGSKLVHEVEKVAAAEKVNMITVNTMDWEALPFYQKLGFEIEHVREGFWNDSKMYMLRKNLRH